MARTNDYSDSDEAKEMVQSARDDIREWFKTEEDADYDGARERAETHADNALTYNRNAWLIVHCFDLEQETSEYASDGGTLQQLANAIAYEHLINEAMDEWDDIQNEIDNGDVFWCKEHREWHEADYRCDDCDDGICPEKVKEQTTPKNATYCEDCAPDHTCVDCHELKDDADFNTDYGLVLCDACSQKRETENNE